ncbi:MAG: OsmC family protein [Flavobacteriales bacterium]
MKSMGSTATLHYSGNLRTTLTHTRSGTQVETDAPVDNHGKGERFSPTDMLSASLGACMVTIMGIAADTHGIRFDDVQADIVKHMAADPRRVSKIEVHLRIKGSFSDKEKTILERAGMTCPVFLSLHPDLEKEISFSWEG